MKLLLITYVWKCWRRFPCLFFLFPNLLFFFKIRMLMAFLMLTISWISLQVVEQMQENLLGGRGIVFPSILEAVSFQGSGDKIKIPPSCFTELSDQGAFDKGTLYFQLSVIHQEGSSEMINADSKQLTTHSGVLEFTAEEGSGGLPPHVWSNLFPLDSPKAPLIEVRYVWLPKGTYAKLEPDVFGFSNLPNHKAVLETSLRQHATLSKVI